MAKTNSGSLAEKREDQINYFDTESKMNIVVNYATYSNDSNENIKRLIAAAYGKKITL